MIEVGVGEQDEIDAGQFGGFQGAGDVALGADGERRDADTAPVEEDGVGEDVDAEEIDEDGGVAQPRRGDLIVAPGLRLRMVWCRSSGAGAVAEHHGQETESWHGRRRNDSGLAGNKNPAYSCGP